MSHPIPPDAQRLADRLRMFADEIESAARYGIPIPTVVSADGFEHGSGATFAANLAEFDAWAEYTEAQVEEYDHAGRHWSRAVADVNGLHMSFAVQHPTLDRATFLKLADEAEAVMGS